MTIFLHPSTFEHWTFANIFNNQLFAKADVYLYSYWNTPRSYATPLRKTLQSRRHQRSILQIRDFQQPVLCVNSHVRRFTVCIFHSGPMNGFKCTVRFEGRLFSARLKIWTPLKRHIFTRFAPESSTRRHVWHCQQLLNVMPLTSVAFTVNNFQREIVVVVVASQTTEVHVDTERTGCLLAKS